MSDRNQKRSFFAALKGLFTKSPAKPQTPSVPEKPLRPAEPEPICGGTTDNTNVNAPKEIGSKDITALYMRFFQDNRWTADEQRQFEFSLAPDEAGVLTASERVSGLRHPADEALMKALQQIIEEEGLAKENGVDRVTAGLPPEYQPCIVRIDYASGEKLSFTQNNNPYARWSERVYDVFADWFASFGETGLLPERETSTVVRIRTEFNENGLLLRYGGMNVSEEKAVNGETYLFRRIVYDVAERKNLSGKYVPFPADFGERVSAILDEYELARHYDFSRFDHDAKNYGNHENGYFGFGPGHEADAEDLGVTLHVVYENGNRFNIDTRKPGEIEGMKPMLTALFTFYDSLFD